MKYYIIEEIVNYGSQVSKPLCVVEKEEIAKDVIKRYNGLTYFEYETEKTKMTKGLEAFRKIKEYLVNLQFHFLEEELFTIEKELKENEMLKQRFGELDDKCCVLYLKNQENQKKLKAFEIIKDKDVNPIDIRCCDTVEQYNVKENGNIPLIKEEFDILKEVLL